MNELEVLKPVYRIRDHHHRIAFLVAQGKKTVEISQATGLSTSSISSIKRIQEFKDLVEKYRTQQVIIEYDAFRQATQIRAAIEQLSLEELRDRLEENPEKFTTRDLLDIQADAADRLGRSKVSRQESLSMSIDLADSLAEARRREMKLSASPALPGDAEGGLVTSSPAEGPTPQ